MDSFLYKRTFRFIGVIPVVCNQGQSKKLKRNNCLFSLGEGSICAMYYALLPKTQEQAYPNRAEKEWKGARIHLFV